MKRGRSQSARPVEAMGVRGAAADAHGGSPAGRRRTIRADRDAGPAHRHDTFASLTFADLARAAAVSALAAGSGPLPFRRSSFGKGPRDENFLETLLCRVRRLCPERGHARFWHAPHCRAPVTPKI